MCAGNSCVATRCRPVSPLRAIRIDVIDVAFGVTTSWIHQRVNSPAPRASKGEKVQGRKGHRRKRSSLQLLPIDIIPIIGHFGGFSQGAIYRGYAHYLTKTKVTTIDEETFHCGRAGMYNEASAMITCPLGRKNNTSLTTLSSVVSLSTHHPSPIQGRKPKDTHHRLSSRAAHVATSGGLVLVTVKDDPARTATTTRETSPGARVPCAR